VMGRGNSSKLNNSDHHPRIALSGS